jgi:hypothetical protein
MLPLARDHSGEWTQVPDTTGRLVHDFMSPNRNGYTAHSGLASRIIQSVQTLQDVSK